MNIFIGSSGESRRVATTLAELLEEHQPIRCRVWKEGEFELGGSPIPSLEKAAANADYGVFVFGRDDVRLDQGKEVWVPRDNVVFETGLFFGLLGPDRCFLVVATETKPGSDFEGITSASFDPEAFEEEPQRSLRAAVNAILSVVLKGRTRPHVGVSRMNIDQFYSETGLTEAFPTRTDASRRMLTDIESAESSIAMYARVYLSELISGQGSFVSALEKAATKTRTTSTLELSQTTIDPDDPQLLAWSWQLEKTEDPPRFQTLESYREHVTEKGDLIATTHRNLQERLSEIKPADRKRVQVVGRYLACPIPYSLLIIDRTIVWVSYYWRIRLDPPHGKFAPTMRLVCSSEEDSWARKLVDQAAQIDASSSYLKTKYPLI